MLCFEQVFLAVLEAVAADVFADRCLHKRQAIGFGEVEHVNLHAPIVVAADLLAGASQMAAT